MLDVEKLIQGVHKYMERALAPLTVKLAAQQQEIAELREALSGAEAAAVTDVLREEIASAVGKALSERVLPDLAAEVLPTLREELRKAVAELPPPKDGQSVTVADVEPLLEQRMAAWALDFERRAQGVLERAIDRMPKAKDGRDGFGFEDLNVEFDGERTATLVFRRADEEKRFPIHLPTVIDRGVYRPDATYAKHDGVTFGGSFWIAQKDQPGKPAEGSDGWRLAVKRGRDGRDGERGEKGEPGRPVPEFCR